jgi:hypothetical protein
MALSRDDIQFIKAHMGEWLAEQTRQTLRRP